CSVSPWRFSPIPSTSRSPALDVLVPADTGAALGGAAGLLGGGVGLGLGLGVAVGGGSAGTLLLTTGGATAGDGAPVMDVSPSSSQASRPEPAFCCGMTGGSV